MPETASGLPAELSQGSIRSIALRKVVNLGPVWNVRKKDQTELMPFRVPVLKRLSAAWLVATVWKELIYMYLRLCVQFCKRPLSERDSRVWREGGREQGQQCNGGRGRPTFSRCTASQLAMGHRKKYLNSEKRKPEKGASQLKKFTRSVIRNHLKKVQHI